MSAVLGVVDVYERLLRRDTDKDVEIMLSDGSVWGHSIILSANSDAIAGILKHGVAAEQKKLHWEDYTKVTGRFVLRLMYTGTVDPEEWNNDCNDAPNSEDEIPLQLLLDALAIAKVYLVENVLASITEALANHIGVDNFDDIMRCAIKYDVTALRLSCLQFVEETKSEDEIVVTGSGLAEFNGRYQRQEEKLNGKNKYRKLDGSDHTINWSKGNWFLAKNYNNSWYLVGSNDDHPPATGWTVGGRGTAPAPNVERPQRTKDRMQEKYHAKAFAPEVMVELAPIFGTAQHAGKKRRSFGMFDGIQQFWKQQRTK